MNLEEIFDEQQDKINIFSMDGIKLIQDTCIGQLKKYFNTELYFEFYPS